MLKIGPSNSGTDGGTDEERLAWLSSGIRRHILVVNIGILVCSLPLLVSRPP